MGLVKPIIASAVPRDRKRVKHGDRAFVEQTRRAAKGVIHRLVSSVDESRKIAARHE